MSYKWIKLSETAQAAAKWQARRGYDGSAGTPLPSLMDSKTAAEIRENQFLFKLAVHMFNGSSQCKSN